MGMGARYSDLLCMRRKGRNDGVSGSVLLNEHGVGMKIRKSNSSVNCTEDRQSSFVDLSLR